ncbi:hypothetical protein [Spartinivicinus ruber]|uniref:hypothetical protein n=1 Tax=Spartinivicinus ruber TaxID=2683272 RepID=UPI0013D796F6|nr:hypothetical protein [Spartinivicinus ruber]
MKKIIITLSLLIMIFASGALFLKWAEKGLATPDWEVISPNKKFKIVIYCVAEYKSFAKLYNNETGVFIGESPVVDSGAGTGIWWDPDGYLAFLDMSMLFDIGEFDTKHTTFTELRQYKINN